MNAPNDLLSVEYYYVIGFKRLLAMPPFNRLKGK